MRVRRRCRRRRRRDRRRRYLYTVRRGFSRYNAAAAEGVYTRARTSVYTCSLIKHERV